MLDLSGSFREWYSKWYLGSLAEKARRLLFVLLFLVFPLFLAFFGNRILFLEIEDKARIDAESRLEEAFNQVESDKSPMPYFSRYFGRIERKILSSDDPQGLLRKFLPFFQSRFGGGIQVVYLDPAGKPVRELCTRQVSGPLAKKFFESYGIFLSQKKPLSDTAQSFMKSFLSPNASIDKQCHGALIFCSNHPIERFVYFSKPGSKGMIIFFFTPPLPIRELALLDQISRMNRKNPRLRLCLARRGEKAGTVLDRLGIKERINGPFWKRLQGSGLGKAWFDEILISRRTLFSRLWVVGECTITTAPFLDFRGFLSSLPARIVLFCLTVFGIIRLISVSRVLASVRVKLLAAFLYSVCVPLIIMGITARSFLEERTLVLENEHHQKVERSLMAFDSLFQAYWAKTRVALITHYLSKDVPSENLYEDFRNNFDRYRRKYSFELCRIFDTMGKQVFEYYDSEFPAILGGQIKLLPKMSQSVFATFSERSQQVGGGAPGDRNTGAVPKIDPFLAMANLSFNAFFGQELNLGFIQCFLAGIPLTDAKRNATHMAYFLWNRQKLEWNYLQAELSRFEKSLRLGSFCAWNPNGPESMIPDQFRYKRTVKPFLEKVVSRSSGYRFMLPSPNGSLLLTGIRGTNLRNYSMMCLSPDLEIQGEIRDLSWKFRFITLAIIGVCIIVGILLSRLFLGPLGSLTQGLEAIADRDFSFVIPVVSRDELGNLASLFNQTMDDMKDLEVAKTVQECLFPRKPLFIGTWEIYGSCLPATQVGGDYFDYFRLDEERAIIIIGDVSGHGVAAALVVAMAKAIIGHPSTTGKPIDILVSLNSILFSILKRKKMMSCCLALFDYRTRELTLANAGQSYPIILDTGVPSFLELKGYPLGSTKNWKANSMTVGPLLGQTVFFYTDGLIEALDISGKQIGYDGLMAELPALIRNSAMETEKAIRAWHQEKTREGPPDDDISLIVFQSRNVEAVPHEG